MGLVARSEMAFHVWCLKFELCWTKSELGPLVDWRKIRKRHGIVGICCGFRLEENDKTDSPFSFGNVLLLFFLSPPLLPLIWSRAH
jgi:hypothetical protein